jgi:hypothetical protein
MVEITTLRIWIGIFIAWPLLSMLVFNRWFFFSPLGMLIAFGMPIAGWVLWRKYYREEGQKIALHDKFSVGKGVGILRNLKKRFINQ